MKIRIVGFVVEIESDFSRDWEEREYWPAVLVVNSDGGYEYNMVIERRGELWETSIRKTAVYGSLVGHGIGTTPQESVDFAWKDAPDYLQKRIIECLQSRCGRIGFDAVRDGMVSLGI